MRNEVSSNREKQMAPGKGQADPRRKMGPRRADRGTDRQEPGDSQEHVRGIQDQISRLKGCPKKRKTTLYRRD